MGKDVSRECPSCGSPMPGMFPSIQVEDGELVEICPDDFHQDKEKTERYRKFIEDQFAIFDENSVRISNNTLEFHKEICADHTPQCEQRFVQVFMMMFDERIRQEMEKKNKPFDPSLN